MPPKSAVPGRTGSGGQSSANSHSNGDGSAGGHAQGSYSSSGRSSNSIYLPLFERLDNVELQELQHCKQLIEKLQSRVKDLEEINLNLEHRLEGESKANISLERKCVQIQNSWREKTEVLSKEIEEQRRTIANEKAKNEKLRENLSRNERELYGILQRKYEYMKGGPNNPRSGQLLSSDSNKGGPPGKALQGPSAAGGVGVNKEGNSEDFYQIRAPQDAKQRKMTTNLSEFLGIGL
jgi:hypothetical protein